MLVLLPNMSIQVVLARKRLGAPVVLAAQPHGILGSTSHALLVPRQVSLEMERGVAAWCGASEALDVLAVAVAVEFAAQPEGFIAVCACVACL